MLTSIYDVFPTSSHLRTWRDDSHYLFCIFEYHAGFKFECFKSRQDANPSIHTTLADYYKLQKNAEISQGFLSFLSEEKGYNISSITIKLQACEGRKIKHITNE